MQRNAFVWCCYKRNSFSLIQGDEMGRNRLDVYPASGSTNAIYWKKETKQKINLSYIKKKTLFLRCHTKEQSLFLWSPSMTKYLLLLQIRHFEMQILNVEKKGEAALNKSGFGLKGFTLCRCTTFQDGSSDHWASAETEAAVLGTSCNVQSRVWSHWQETLLWNRAREQCVAEKYAQRGIHD